MTEERYDISKEIIGNGAYGMVYSAVDRFTGKVVAVKCMKHILSSHAVFVQTLREVSFNRIVRRQAPGAVVKMLDVVLAEDGNEIRLVLERMPETLGRVISTGIGRCSECHVIA